MTFKKMNIIEKTWLKLSNRERYIEYKILLGIQQVPDFNIAIDDGEQVHFKHSGNVGDIIYSLPTIFSLAKKNKICLHLHLNQKGIYGKNFHPLGNVMLNESMYNNIKPLLEYQPNFKTCDIYTNQTIHYNLDLFRKYPIDTKRGNIARYYFQAFAVSPDLCCPWLQANANTQFNDSIVIARSNRYRMPGISYAFLKKYNNLFFVGLEKEYNEMRTELPNIQYLPVKNFLDLANIIAGCKFFIGNQSFPFALAEALKVPRLLEVYQPCPNVIVAGSNGYDFSFQPQFEHIVQQLINH
jgi:hypothetical protein